MTTRPRQDEADPGEVFVCLVCARTFRDRAASQPVGVKGTSYVKNTRRKGGEVLTERVDELVHVEKRKAVADKTHACADHTALHEYASLRFELDADGKAHVVGGTRRE
jgi:hypothetical protein